MSDKQEQATEQRKKKAREQGDVPVSRELTSSMVLLGALLMLPPASEQFLRLWQGAVQASLQAAPGAFTEPTELVHACVLPFAPSLMPVLFVLAAALAASVCLGAAQAGGLQIHGEALAFKLERLSPVSHAKQIFGTRSLMRLAKSLLPAAAVLFLAKKTLMTQLTSMPFLTPGRVPAALAGAYSLSLSTAWIAVGWSGLDYAMERRNWSQKLRMSKQDIREEAKESNGNPHTKGRIRQVQRAMRKRRVKADVSKATVVITNPTHYAVALSFDQETMSAPRVLCKGRDLHALEIREEARWAGVPIVENVPLARSLYRTVEEGQPIPFELYTAVAAILAYLLRRDQPRPAATNAGTLPKETR